MLHVRETVVTMVAVRPCFRLFRIGGPKHRAYIPAYAKPRPLLSSDFDTGGDRNKLKTNIETGLVDP